MTVSAVFWTEFLLEDYDHCIPGDNTLQCFSTENETMDELIDCSKNSSSSSVICYKFTFAFDEAFTSAGGVFVICTAEFVGIVTFSLLIYTQCCKCCYYCVQILATLILTSGDVILFLFLPVVFFTNREVTMFFLKLSVISGAAVIASYMPMFGFERKQPTQVLPYDDHELTEGVTKYSANNIDSDV